VGLITAIFIPAGWWPNEQLAKLVGPTILNLLPILIGYTGGRLVHGQRGAVVGAIATMGVIVGTDIPMFLGAMIIGPSTAFLLKKIDGYVQQRTRAGFEMLVDNYTAGILGMVMAILGLLAVGPIVETFANAAGDVVDTMVTNHVLPLLSIVVEPAKVQFLNNAINHGVLGPLGVTQSLESGKSILFMIETNPGPGLGILLAYWFFGPRTLRPSAPGAIIIHFFGGIHEIYFPYVLMNPRLILAAIAGGASGVFVAVVTGAGLVATPAPGSIFAYLSVMPKDGAFGVLLDIAVATVVSFGASAALLGFGRAEQPVAEAATSGAATALPINPTGA